MIPVTQINKEELKKEFRKRFIKTVKMETLSKDRKGIRKYEYERISGTPDELWKWIESNLGDYKNTSYTLSSINLGNDIVKEFYEANKIIGII